MEGASAVGLVDGARVALVFGAISALFAGVAFARKRPSARSGTSAPARRSRASVARFALSQGIIALALYVYYRAGGWTLDSVGVSKRVSPLVAFLTGLGEFGLFTLLTRWTFAFFGSPFAYLQAVTRANALFAPRGRARGVAMIAMAALINPVVEELMFRGLLVYQLVVVGSPVWLALLVGALVNATNHAYQGRLGVVFHLTFYAAAVGLLFSPVGLVGAIGFHFGGGLLPVIQYRAHLRAYRAARRARRSNAGLQRTPRSHSLGRRS